MSGLSREIIEGAGLAEAIWTLLAPVGLGLALAAVADALADWHLSLQVDDRNRAARLIVARARTVAAGWDTLAQAALVVYAAVLALSTSLPVENPSDADLALTWALVAAQVALIAALIARRVGRWRLLDLYDHERGDPDAGR